MKDINNNRDNTSEKMMEQEQDFLIREMIRKDMIKNIEDRFRNNDEETLKALKNLIHDDKVKTDIW